MDTPHSRHRAGLDLSSSTAGTCWGQVGGEALSGRAVPCAPGGVAPVLCCCRREPFIIGCSHDVAQEAHAFAKAASLDTHKALVHIFFAQRATKKAREPSQAPEP